VTLSPSSPSAEHVDARGILAFLDAASVAGIELHSLAIARHGRVITRGWWAPYSADRVQLVYSLSKSMTATAVATLVDRGELHLDDRVLDRLPTDGIEIDARWSDVEVQHCLSMTVGHTTDAIDAAFARADADPEHPIDLLAAVLAGGPDAAPGSVFCYNQVATYVLSRIVAHVTGKPLTDVLRERVLGPLGGGEMLWHRCRHGYELGFSGCHVRTDDILSMAQLWLDRGRWGGAQLIADRWFDRATTPFLPVPPSATSDWECGYGFSYWIARHGYRGDGAYGQYAIVLTEYDTAIAITSEQEDMQATLDLVWQHVLPALDAAGVSTSDAELAERMATQEIEPWRGDGSLPPDVSVFALGGHLPPSYSSLAVSPDGDDAEVTLLVDGDDVTIPVGNGRWVEGSLAIGDGVLPTAASGGWSDGQFRAAVRLVETPHTLLVGADPATGQAIARWRLIPLSGPDPRGLAVRPRSA
jgi:CubicO group peptidase (beta-lactamase class C family)